MVLALWKEKKLRPSLFEFKHIVVISMIYLTVNRGQDSKITPPVVGSFKRKWDSFSNMALETVLCKKGWPEN